MKGVEHSCSTCCELVGVGCDGPIVVGDVIDHLIVIKF